MPPDTTAKSKFPIYLLGLIAGLQLIDPTVANIALVSAGHDLGFAGSVMALAASISTLALAATVLASGVAADRLGRRKVLVGGMILAAVGDIIAALTPVTAGFLAGRALAGVGLGAALAATFAYVRFVTPPAKVGAALGMWNAVMMAAMIIGSLIGSGLANVSWRFALLLVPALALIMVPLVLKVLPPMPKSGTGKIDYPGLVTIGISMVLLLYGIAQAAKSLTAPSFIIPVVLGLCGFVLFAFIELKSKYPSFPIRLFGQGIFVAAVVSGIAWNFSQAVFQLSSSNWWQYVSGSSTLEVSILQMPMLLTVTVAAIFIGRRLSAAPKLMNKIFISGFVLLVVGFGVSAVASVDGSTWWIIPGSVLIGLGLASVSVPQSVMFVAAAPKAFFGAVTSFRTTVGQLGYAIGLSGSVVVVQLFSRSRFTENLEHAGVPPSRYGQGLDDVQVFLDSGDRPSGELAKTAIEQAERAYSTGYDAVMIVAAIVVAVLGVISMFALRWAKRQNQRADSSPKSPSDATASAANAHPSPAAEVTETKPESPASTGTHTPAKTEES